MLEAPVTVAKSCWVLSVPVETGRKAYDGEMATATGPPPDGPAMTIEAAPLCDGSAWLVAVSVTGFMAGTDDGAR